MAANGWDKRKNPEPALRAFAHLRMRKPGARLKMYGADFGPGERAEQWVQQRGIAKGMEFIGRVPYRQLLDGLADSDVLVHPSLEETFGMTLAEAMAQGVPVIGGAHSGAVPWVVGEGGILTDVTSEAAIEQAMLDLLDTPERYRAAASAAKAHAHSNFTVARVADAYETLYRQVAGEMICNGRKSSHQSIAGQASRG
jgi:glycosyltransferase involved in cell wall biosynthesis